MTETRAVTAVAKITFDQDARFSHARRKPFSNFGLRISFGFRISDFGFICALVVLLFAASATATPAHYPVRIGLLSDLHLNRGTNQVKFQNHLDQVIEAANAAGVDLVLVAGDLTEDGTPREYEEFRRQIKRFSAPVWYVPGNHDVGNKPLPKAKAPVYAVRVARYELKLGPSWFVREHAGVRVVGINSMLLGSDLARERQQWRLLTEALAKPAAQPTILLTHLPPFIRDSREPGGEYWDIEPAPRLRLLSLLQLGGVSNVLSGHLHHALTNCHDGVFFYTTPPVSFGLPAGKQLPGWTLVTVPQRGSAQVEFQPIKD